MIAAAAKPQSDPAIAPEQAVDLAPRQLIQRLQAAAAGAAGGNLVPPIAVFYTNVDFKQGADRALEYLFPGVEVLGHSSVSLIMTELRERAGRIFFLLAESGNTSPRGWQLTNQLAGEIEDGRVISPPVILARRSPSPAGAVADARSGKLYTYGNQRVDMITQTPFDIEELRISVAEAIMRNTNNFERVDELSRAKALRRYLAMISVTMGAWENLLKKPIVTDHGIKPSPNSDPSIQALEMPIEAIQSTANELSETIAMSQVDNAKIVELMRKLRGEMEELSLNLSIVNDQIAQGIIELPDENYLDLFSSITAHLESLRGLMQMMRSAYNNHFEASWYRVLKTLESPVKFKGLKDYELKTSVVQNLLQYVANMSVEMAANVANLTTISEQDEAIADANKLANDREYWSQIVEVLMVLGEMAEKIMGSAVLLKAPILGHHLNNNLSSLVGITPEADHHLESFSPEARGPLKAITTTTEAMQRIGTKTVRILNAGGDWAALQKELMALIEAGKSQ